MKHEQLAESWPVNTLRPANIRHLARTCLHTIFFSLTAPASGWPALFPALNSINVSLPRHLRDFPVTLLPTFFFFFSLFFFFFFFFPALDSFRFFFGSPPFHLFLSPSSVRETRPDRQRSPSPHRHDLYSGPLLCFALLYFAYTHPCTYACALLCDA